MTEQHYIRLSAHPYGVYQLTLNRPEVFNALNDALIDELAAHIAELEGKDARVFVLTGAGKAFAAGGDIAEMAGKNLADVQNGQYVTGVWSKLLRRRRPMIAAVNGLALGGGCELTLLADIAIAAKSARFAQPETGLGIIPGAGGTQRLIRAVGKAKAMDMILTGRQIGAIEAERSGLVARVVDDEHLLAEALHAATAIAQKSLPVIEQARSAVNKAHETALESGLAYEQQAFYATFALADQKEGMAAFLEKRAPAWRDC